MIKEKQHINLEVKYRVSKNYSFKKIKEYQNEFINGLLYRIAVPIRQSTLIGHYSFNGLSKEQRKLT